MYAVDRIATGKSPFNGQRITMLDESSKANYQPWRQEEFNADIRVRKMTVVQRWMYKTLLQEAWVCSTRPHLPDSDDDLWMLADCESEEQWQENKTAVLRMFEKVQIDGVSLLVHKRIQSDWERLLEKREIKSEAGRVGAAARHSKISNRIATAKQPLADSCDSLPSKVKESKSQSKEKASTLECEEIVRELGQEENTMKATKQIPILCQTILGVKARLYPEQTLMIQALEAEHKGSAVINAFSDWAIEHKHDEIRNPIAAFLQDADDMLGGGPAKDIARSPEVQNLARELSYLSKGDIQFTDRHKSRLAQHLSDGFSVEEITAAFKEFLGGLDRSDSGNMKFAAKTFSETADQLAYAAGKRKKEAAALSALMESEKIRLEKEAVDDRARLAAAKPVEEVQEVLGEG